MFQFIQSLVNLECMSMWSRRADDRPRLHHRLVVPTKILKKGSRSGSKTINPEKYCLVDFQYGSLDNDCIFDFPYFSFDYNCLKIQLWLVESWYWLCLVGYCVGCWLVGEALIKGVLLPVEVRLTPSSPGTNALYLSMPPTWQVLTQGLFIVGVKEGNGEVSMLVTGSLNRKV